MPKGCIFCAVIAGAESHAIYRDERTVAFLDHAPVIPGHTLVVPTIHYDTLDDLPDDALMPLFSVVRRVSIAQQSALGAEGSLTLANTRISQSVPHVHVHVVPRLDPDPAPSLPLPASAWENARALSDEELAAQVEKLKQALRVT